MATSNKQPDYTFHPFYEAARSTLQSIGAFAGHPVRQSELAMQIAQQMFLEHANVARAGSPLDPNNRPGVPQEALPASAPQQPAGPLTQVDQQQQTAPPPITF